MRFTSKLTVTGIEAGSGAERIEMQYAIAVVILIDDLMMHRRVDLEAGDMLEPILARERNPRLDMVGRRTRIAISEW